MKRWPEGLGKMDEQLREIYSLQPLQVDVITYRSNTKLIKKILKQTCLAEAKKLQEVEVLIADKEMKLIQPEEWPKLKKIESPQFDVKEMLENCKRTSQAMELLK